MAHEHDVELVKSKWNFSVAVGWTGYIVALAVVLGVIGSCMVVWINGGIVPDQMANWGTVCIGFLAMLISQARDIIKLGKED